LLQQARYTYSKFDPDYVIGDAGYSSDALRHLIHRQYGAVPIIDPNPSHKKAYARTVKTPEWKAIYKRRTSIERLNGRLKAHRKLDDVRVRGLMKVMLHAMLSVITCQAWALVMEVRECRADNPAYIRRNVRKVA
jgi:transposase